MHILVLNGSPKAEYSATLATVRYLEILHPEHEFDVLHVGVQYRLFEKDFSAAAEKIKAADLILFSYPVYTFIVPSQLHRFLELMKENHVECAGKFATQLSTSKHFYDITAHNFIRDNCFDLGLKYIRGLSADMDDLTKPEGQKQAEDFFDYVVYCMEKDLYEPFPEEQPAPAHVPVPAVSAEEDGSKPGDVVILTDLADEDTQLADMIAYFRHVFPLKTRVVNIHDFPFAGGCISCFNCAPKGECIYKDGFQEMLRNSIQNTQATVIAFSIKDHSMGSRFKMYDDRQFCNGHRTVTMGMPFAYLVSGSYSRETNLRMVVEGRAQVGGNFLAGVATDESDPAEEIRTVAERLAYAVEHKYTQPSNFLGVGGMKIFRDLIWLMQGLMKADHKFYKAHNQYDFPQKKRGTMMAMYLVGGMFANEKIKKKIGGKISEGMYLPYKKVLDSVKEKYKK